MSLRLLIISTPQQDGGAHRVHAGGPGLERGVQGQPADFNVWTREAGRGSLAISVEGTVFQIPDIGAYVFPSISGLFVRILKHKSPDILAKKSGNQSMLSISGLKVR